MLSTAEKESRAKLYFSFTSPSQSGPLIGVSDFNNVLVMVQGTYAAGLTIMFEGSMDGVTWVSVSGITTVNTSAVSPFTLSTNSVYAFILNVSALNYFRIRSTTWASPSGQCDVWCAGTEHGVATAVSAAIAATVGSYTPSMSAPGNGVIAGGHVKSAVDTTMVDGDASHLTMTTARQLITKEFGSAELDWQYNTQGLTTTTTAAAAKTAGAASVRNYVTGIQATNYGASDVRLLILDGSTTIWGKTIKAGATISEAFKTPLRGTAATALNYNFSAAGASIDLNIQGYQNF